jgi:hypothetical protein
MGSVISWFVKEPEKENNEDLQDYEFIPPPPPLKRQIGYCKQQILDQSK